jgi:branched-chain amino acid transport system substrate-binding protein
MRFRIFATALAGALLVAGCASKQDPGAGSPAGADKLVLGASLSLTGSLAREGNLTKEGYEVCKQVVNAKGGVPVGDKKLMLDIEFQDDASKPDTAGQVVDNYNGKGIKLVLGPYGSATTEAAAAVIERNNQVMAEGAGADDKIFNKGYKRTFAVLSPAKSYVASMVQAIYDLADPKPKTIAFVSADDGFSKTAAAGGVAKAKELGFEVVAEEYVPNGTSDVSTALTKIKPKNPDVILGSVHLAEGIAIIKQSKELGLAPKGFGETVAPPTPDFVKTLAASAEGVLGSSQWTTKTAGSDKYFGTATEYATTFAGQFSGRQPQYHGAEATAACLAMVLAVEKAGSIEPDKVRDALAALDTPSFFGPLKFTEKGQNLTKQMVVIQIQDGKQMTVWPKESAEAPLKWPGTKS